mgnify:CR=1 FL=1
MDLSISYHPITKEQMKEWYFDAFEDIGVAETLKVKIPQEQLRRHNSEELEAFYQDKYKTMIKRSRELDYEKRSQYGIFQHLGVKCPYEYSNIFFTDTL